MTFPAKRLFTEFSLPVCAHRWAGDAMLIGNEDAILVFDSRDKLIDFRAADAIKEIEWNIIRASYDINAYLDSCMP